MSVVTIPVTFEMGDIVKLKVDAENTSPGVICAYKILPGATVEYLVTWDQVTTTWHFEHELEPSQVAIQM